MNWIAPDAEGISTVYLDEGGPRRPSRRRLRAAMAVQAEAVVLSTEERRELLREWHRLGSTRSRWETFLKVAGPHRAQLAHELRDDLLRCGLLRVEERRNRDGQWVATWCGLTLGDTPRSFGWPDPAQRDADWRSLRVIPIVDPVIRSAAMRLDHLPVPIAIHRLRLLHSLERWKELGRLGTRRDFAQWATGATKDVTFSDWKWLEEALPVEDFGVERHTPMLLLRGPMSLVFAGGRLDLASVSDFIGITPATLQQVISVEGTCACWRIIENRTSYERAARKYGAADGVVWLPGFAPISWRRQMSVLLKMCPAPGFIACDPDPSGIEIALDAASVWEALGVTWKPWQMDAAVLKGMAIKRSLSEEDKTVLGRLEAREMPDQLRGLRDYILQSGQKGEQEIIDL